VMPTISTGPDDLFFKNYSPRDMAIVITYLIIGLVKGKVIKLPDVVRAAYQKKGKDEERGGVAKKKQRLSLAMKDAIKTNEEERKYANNNKIDASEVLKIYLNIEEKVLESYLDHVDLGDVRGDFNSPENIIRLKSIKGFRTARVNAFKLWSEDNGTDIATGGGLGASLASSSSTQASMSRMQKLAERYNQTKKRIQSAAISVGENEG